MSLEMDNESQELEKYGVWVKKSAPAPEPEPMETSAEDLVADLPDITFVEDPAVEPELSEMPDFSDIMSDDSVFEEPVSEPVADDSILTSTEEADFEIPALDQTETTDSDTSDDFEISDMEMPDISDFAITENINLDELSDTFTAPPAAEETPFEDISFDVFEESPVEGTDEVNLDSFEEISPDDFTMPDSFEPAEEPEQSPAAEAEPVTAEIPEEVTITADTDDQDIFGDVSFEDVSASAIDNFGDIQFEDATNQIPFSDQQEDSAEPVEAVFDIPADSDTTEISFETESGEPEPAGDSLVTEEIDIDSFLDFSDDVMEGTHSEEVSFEDTGIRDFTSSEAVSLDDFMAVPQTEKNDIVNEEPLGIELSFDDSFTSETQASPENDIETEMAGASEPVDSFDVDDIFDSIQEVSFTEGDTTVEPATETVASDEEITFDEVSEFDDLLGSLNDDTNEPSDHENVSMTQTATFTPSTPTVRDYEMTVSMDDADDDDFDELSSTVSSKVADTPVAEAPVEESTTEPELTEDDVMTDDMKAVLAQIGDDFASDDNVAITQDALDALTHTHDSTTGTPVEEGPAMADNMNTALLEKILTELTSLKSEVASIRSDVDALKAAQPAEAGESDAVSDETSAEEPVIEEDVTEDTEIPMPAADTSSGGFFGSDDEDDTIALSGDELDNILNCANFTEEEAPAMAVETPADDFYEDAAEPESETLSESFDSMSTNLEEPVIDEFAMDMPESTEENDLPEEIEIPQMDDDFIVESSTNDFLDGMEEEKSIADSITDANDTFLSSDSNIDSMTEDLGNTEEALEVAENEPLEDTEDPETEQDTTDTSFPTEEDIMLSEEEDESFQVFDEDEVTDELEKNEIPLSEYIDEEVDTTPTEDVFGAEQWSEASEESVFADEPAVEETPVVEDSVFADEPAVEETPVVEDSVFADEPAVEETPVADESVFEEEPVVEDSVFADEPAVEETSVADEPVFEEEPVIEDSVFAEEPAVEETPVVEDSVFADEPAVEETSVADEPAVADIPAEATDETIPDDLKEDVKSVLMYMDQLLENLPEDKIAEFARSEHFDVYKKLFTELGLA